MIKQWSKWVKPILSPSLWLLAFLGYSDVQKHIPGSQNVEEWVWRTLTFGFGLAGVAVLFLPAIEFCRRGTERRRRLEARGFTAQAVKPASTEALHKFCASFYEREDHIINPDSLKEFVQASPHTAKVICSKDGRQVGLYIVFGINKDAVRKLLDGTFANAQKLRSRHAVKDWARASGLYVTNVAAVKEGIIPGVVMGFLIEDIGDYLCRYRSIQYVFGRLANEDGERVFKNKEYKFSKTNPNLPDNQIWKLEVTPALLRQIQERKQ